MIVITGATGQLGSRIVDGLLERIPADQVGVSVRDPDRAEHLAARGVRVRRGDFADPATLASAFEGAAQVLVVSGNTLGEEGVAQHRAAIDAAYRAGARRVLYTSHQASNPDSLFAPARDHAATEAHLVSTGLPFTSLRDGFHAASLQHVVGGAVETGELRAPADGPMSWTTHADLAAAAAVLLTDEDAVDGADSATPVLTAAEAIDLEGVAGILSELSGRPVRRIVVDDDDYVAGLLAHGVPEAGARMFLGMFQAARRGEFAVTDPTLARLLGRAPQTVGSTLGVATAVS